MRLLRTAIKTGIATKLFNEARKPHNQEKLRRLVKQATAKGRSRTAR